MPSLDQQILAAYGLFDSDPRSHGGPDHYDAFRDAVATLLVFQGDPDQEALGILRQSEKQYTTLADITSQSTSAEYVCPDCRAGRFASLSREQRDQHFHSGCMGEAALKRIANAR